MAAAPPPVDLLGDLSTSCFPVRWRRFDRRKRQLLRLVLLRLGFVVEVRSRSRFCVGKIWIPFRFGLGLGFFWVVFVNSVAAADVVED